MSDSSNLAEAIGRVEGYWEIPDGFLYRLRQGDFDPAGATSLQDTLAAIDVTSLEALPRRLVALTWMIPTVMEWQIEQVEKRGGDAAALRRSIEGIRSALQDILGAP